MLRIVLLKNGEKASRQTFAIAKENKPVMGSDTRQAVAATAASQNEQEPEGLRSKIKRTRREGCS
jgi:hypothetical protein